MRYELTDYEWTAIKPMLPNKPPGVPRVNDRRVLNGILWVLRSGAPWRDLPESYGPPTTCYNRFVRWRQAGVWDRLMNALAAGHDAAVQMIDTSVVRVHQHGACIAGNSEQLMGRSRGGLTTKIHAVVDASGLPVHLALTSGEAQIRNASCSQSKEREAEHPDLVIAALLHDAIEDCEVPYELIAREFGERVASLVKEVTDDKTLAKEERKEEQIKTAGKKSKDAKLIKLADKTSNLRAVTFSPAPNWSVKRRMEYIGFAKEVVAGLRGGSPWLEQQFDRAAEEAERSIAVRAGMV